MLYGIGVVMLLLSLAFTGGTIIVPIAMTIIGVGLMMLGRRTEHGAEENTKG